jgi:nucleoside-diphosphate-sugar epimerase
MPKEIRVAVTGGSGFVGRYAIRHLIARGCEVHCLSRRPPSELHKEITHHDIDLLCADVAPLLTTIAPTHLLHLAWYASPGRFWTSLENLDWVAATIRLVRAFATTGGQRIVGAGTCAEYDWHQVPYEHHLPRLDERRSPSNPATLYGKAKNAARVLLEAAAAEMSLSFAWGRIFFVYGPGESPGRLVPDVVSALLDGRPFECSEGLQRRDFMHVDDVGRAFSELLLSEVEGPVNIATGTSASIREVVKLIAEVADLPSAVRFGAPRPSEPDFLIAATDRLTKELRFSPRFGLREGLADAVRWWRHVRTAETNR